MMTDPRSYRYSAAQALVRLHARHLLAFLETWRRARAADLELPGTADPDYASLETLLRHVFSSSRGYLIWICDVLGLPDPGIGPPPEAASLATEADAYAANLLRRWDGPLAGVDEARFSAPEFRSGWGPAYCVEAMLEHAVMHPLRHEFQLLSRLKEGSAPS